MGAIASPMSINGDNGQGRDGGAKENTVNSGPSHLSTIDESHSDTCAPSDNTLPFSRESSSYRESQWVNGGSSKSRDFGEQGDHDRVYRSTDMCDEQAITTPELTADLSSQSLKIVLRHSTASSPNLGRSTVMTACREKKASSASVQWVEDAPVPLQQSSYEPRSSQLNWTIDYHSATQEERDGITVKIGGQMRKKSNNRDSWKVSNPSIQRGLNLSTTTEATNPRKKRGRPKKHGNIPNDSSIEDIGENKKGRYLPNRPLSTLMDDSVDLGARPPTDTLTVRPKVTASAVLCAETGKTSTTDNIDTIGNSSCIVSVSARGNPKDKCGGQASSIPSASCGNNDRRCANTQIQNVTYSNSITSSQQTEETSMLTSNGMPGGDGKNNECKSASSRSTSGSPAQRCQERLNVNGSCYVFWLPTEEEVQKLRDMDKKGTYTEVFIRTLYEVSNSSVGLSEKFRPFMSCVVDENTGMIVNDREDHAIDESDTSDIQFMTETSKPFKEVLADGNLLIIVRGIIGSGKVSLMTSRLVGARKYPENMSVGGVMGSWAVKVIACAYACANDISIMKSMFIQDNKFYPLCPILYPAEHRPSLLKSMFLTSKAITPVRAFLQEQHLDSKVDAITEEEGCLMLGEMIGDGTFGAVYTVVDNIEFVLKVFKPECDIEDRLNEIMCLGVLQGLNHVPKLYAVCECTPLVDIPPCTLTFNATSNMENSSSTKNWRDTTAPIHTVNRASEDSATSTNVRVFGYVCSRFDHTLLEYHKINPSAEDIFELILGLVTCLRDIHGQCIAHLDLCDRNIMISRRPSHNPGVFNPLQVSIIDFAAACRLSPSMRFLPNPQIAKATYRPPEIFESTKQNEELNDGTSLFVATEESVRVTTLEIRPSTSPSSSTPSIVRGNSTSSEVANGEGYQKGTGTVNTTAAAITVSNQLGRNDHFVDARKIDVWALGVIYTEILTRGIKAWGGEFDPNTLYEIVSDDLMVERHIHSVKGDAWRELLKGCLAIDPERRWLCDRIVQFLVEHRERLVVELEGLPLRSGARSKTARQRKVYEDLSMLNPKPRKKADASKKKTGKPSKTSRGRKPKKSKLSISSIPKSEHTDSPPAAVPVSLLAVKARTTITIPPSSGSPIASQVLPHSNGDFSPLHADVDVGSNGDDMLSGEGELMSDGSHHVMLHETTTSSRNMINQESQMSVMKDVVKCDRMKRLVPSLDTSTDLVSLKKPHVDGMRVPVPVLSDMIGKFNTAPPQPFESDTTVRGKAKSWKWKVNNVPGKACQSPVVNPSTPQSQYTEIQALHSLPGQCSMTNGSIGTSTTNSAARIFAQDAQHTKQAKYYPRHTKSYKAPMVTGDGRFSYVQFAPVYSPRSIPEQRRLTPIVNLTTEQTLADTVYDDAGSIVTTRPTPHSITENARYTNNDKPSARIILPTSPMIVSSGSDSESSSPFLIRTTSSRTGRKAQSQRIPKPHISRQLMPIPQFTIKPPRNDTNRDAYASNQPKPTIQRLSDLVRVCSQSQSQPTHALTCIPSDSDCPTQSSALSWPLLSGESQCQTRFNPLRGHLSNHPQRSHHYQAIQAQHQHIPSSNVHDIEELQQESGHGYHEEPQRIQQNSQLSAQLSVRRSQVLQQPEWPPPTMQRPLQRAPHIPPQQYPQHSQPSQQSGVSRLSHSSVHRHQSQPLMLAKQPLPHEQRPLPVQTESFSRRPHERNRSSPSHVPHAEYRLPYQQSQTHHEQPQIHRQMPPLHQQPPPLRVSQRHASNEYQHHPLQPQYARHHRYQHSPPFAQPRSSQQMRPRRSYKYNDESPSIAPHRSSSEFNQEYSASHQQPHQY